jgi:uncharacterized protein
MKNYDIVIVGAGASGVFLAYELTKINNTAKVLMIEKGYPLKRGCALLNWAKLILASSAYRARL